MLRSTIGQQDKSRGGSIENWMVRLAGFEPATYGLEVRCSIQLSYRRT